MVGSTSSFKVIEALQHPLRLYAHFGPSLPNQRILACRLGLHVFSMQKLQLYSLKGFSSNHTVRCQDSLKFLKMCCWHVGCWLPPKKGCKSCKVLLKTALVVASTVRRHWSSEIRTLKLYTCCDVIAYRLSDHASTCQRCGFFSCNNYSCYSKLKNALR